MFTLRQTKSRLARATWRLQRPAICLRGYATESAPQVNDEDVAKLAAKPIHPLTLADLVKHGWPPLSEKSLYGSANFALSVLPTRLAHRIHSLRNLPFIVVTNPNVSQIHNNYMQSLSALLPFTERRIETPQEEDKFTEVLAGLVQTHSNTIPTLARGFLESRKYISQSDVTKFLDEHLRARIGTRLVAEQHIALHYASKPDEDDNTPRSRADSTEASSYIGVIDTTLRPATVVRNCESFVAEMCELNYGVRPSVIINGEPGTRIAHVPVHLEYIITELLKNSFRATVENGSERDPIEVTIAPAPEDSMETLSEIKLEDQGEPGHEAASIKPFDKATPGVTIRIRDRGGGIDPAALPKLWNYGFTTFKDNCSSDDSGSLPGVGSDALSVISNANAGGSTLAGLGYGLPLGRAYAEYFGGRLTIQPLWGWGTDVYLSLRGVGKIE